MTKLSPRGTEANYELDAYQRDNLLSLLTAVSGMAGPSPLAIANTGDWVIEVMVVLGYRDTDTDFGRPNVTAELLASQAQREAGR